jgi:hypothetical protein
MVATGTTPATGISGSAAVACEPLDLAVGDQPAAAEPDRPDPFQVGKPVEVPDGHPQVAGRLGERPRTPGRVRRQEER